jgi:hypothetical protein
MLSQERFYILRDWDGLFSLKIEVYHDGMPLDAKPALLPGFVVNRKRFGSDPAYGSANLHFRKIHLRYKIVIRMGHDKRPGIEVYLKAGAEDFKKGSAGLFKPFGQYRIVDVPQAVGIPETGLYHSSKHGGSLPFQYKPIGR